MSEFSPSAAETSDMQLVPTTGQHRVCLVCGNAAALPSACLRGAAPHPSSAQSPHRLKRPAGEGISNSASLRLLLPTKSFDFAGDPNITKGRQL